MTETIKVHNRGQRSVIYGDKPEARHAPGEVVEYPPAVAEKVLKLYPKEMFDLAASTKVFEESKPAAEEEAKAPAKVKASK